MRSPGPSLAGSATPIRTSSRTRRSRPPMARSRLRSGANASGRGSAEPWACRPWRTILSTRRMATGWPTGPISSGPWPPASRSAPPPTGWQRSRRRTSRPGRSTRSTKRLRPRGRPAERSGSTIRGSARSPRWHLHSTWRRRRRRFGCRRRCSATTPTRSSRSSGAVRTRPRACGRTVSSDPTRWASAAEGPEKARGEAMRVGSGAIRFTRVAAMVAAGSLLLAACGGNSSPRPTDPREILTQAVTATAALPSVRIHIEALSQTAGFGGAGPTRANTTLDGDIDLVNRQLTGRATMQMTGADAGLANGQVVGETIITTNAMFTRTSATGRWMKLPMNGLGGGPTNAQIAQIATNLLSNPAVSLELGEAASCTLGTCDHVIAHIDGAMLVKALGPMIGVSPDGVASNSVPNFDLDVLVDQATSVISEVRTGSSIQGSQFAVLITLSNPGEPVQIAAPPAALVDNFGM